MSLTVTVNFESNSHITFKKGSDVHTDQPYGPITITSARNPEANWEGQACEYDGVYYLDPDTGPPINSALEGATTPNGKKVNTKTKDGRVDGAKALIADPGFHFKLDLHQWEPSFQSFLTDNTTKLQVRVYIDVFDDWKGDTAMNEESSHRTLNTSILFTMDGQGQKLDLSDPMRVLIPFVDTNWRKETHHDNVLNFILHAMVFDNSSFTIDFPLVVGTFKKSQKSSGPFVNGHIAEHIPEGMPWACYSQNGQMITLPNDQLIASPDGKEVKLPDGKVINTEKELVIKDIIYTKEGVWFNIHYPNNAPTATYVFAPGGASTNFYSPRSSDGHQTVDPFEACFLPYPRLQEGINPLDCSLKVGNYRDKYIFRPPAGHKETYNSVFLISGSELPAAPGDELASLPVNEAAADLKVAKGLLARILDWIRNLFG
jgi:hypothetical protein